MCNILYFGTGGTNAQPLPNGPIAAVLKAPSDASRQINLEPVGEIDVIKNIFEKNGRSPQKNGIQTQCIVFL